MRQRHGKNPPTQNRRCPEKRGTCPSPRPRRSSAPRKVRGSANASAPESGCRAGHTPPAPRPRHPARHHPPAGTPRPAATACAATPDTRANPASSHIPERPQTALQPPRFSFLPIRKRVILADFDMYILPYSRPISKPFGGFLRPLKNGSSRNLGGRAAWGRVCGRAKLGAGTLRCLHLCWRLPWNWSNAEQLGRCPKPHKGRCPLTLQGAIAP